MPRTVFDMFTEFVKRAEMKRDDVRNVALPQEKRQRRKVNSLSFVFRIVNIRCARLMIPRLVSKISIDVGIFFQ